MPTTTRQATPDTTHRGTRTLRPSRRMGPVTGTTAAVLLAGLLALPGGQAEAATPTDTGGRADSTVAAPVLTAASTAATRPANGAVLIKRGSGSGRFTVDNTRGAEDAAVTLSRGGRAVLLIYVRAGSRATSTRIPDGTFDVFVERGTGWDRAAMRFATSTSAGRFDRQAHFSTERVRGGIRYSTITLTLYGVPNGNARVLPVPEASIPN